MTMRDAGREQFPHFQPIPTRWMDNDIYGPVNNVVYYSYVDTAVNQFLIERGVLDIHQGEVVGFVVDSGCSYFSSISFPDTIHAGIRVAKLGNSSVRYELALYRNDDPCPAPPAISSMSTSSAAAIARCQSQCRCACCWRRCATHHNPGLECFVARLC
jgi:acyl-CoA thioester hydrolase